MMELLGIGERLRETRQALHMTRGELAHRTGVPAPQWKFADDGEPGATLGVLIGLALHFPALDMNWLLVGRGELVLRDGAPVLRDELDPAALAVAQRLFQAEMALCCETAAAQLATFEASYLTRLYQTYMSHLHAFRAGGVPNAEARERARAECERMAQLPGIEMPERGMG